HTGRAHGLHPPPALRKRREEKRREEKRREEKFFVDRMHINSKYLRLNY
ncbi:hypothetical protein QLL30_001536, partial [Neisseria gonorrhoeae]